VLGQAQIVPLFGMLREVFAAGIREMHGRQKQLHFTGKNGNYFGPKSAGNRSSSRASAGPVKNLSARPPQGPTTMANSLKFLTSREQLRGRSSIARIAEDEEPSLALPACNSNEKQTGSSPPIGSRAKKAEA